MATQKEKLQKVKEIKTSIKDVINANGGNVGEVFSEYPLAIETLLSGGGSDSPKGQYRVRYFDIDGTILKEEYLDSGATLTPPKAPNYDPDYLVFDTWNYDIENVVVDRDLDIGAIYNTIDGSTYLFCRFTKTTKLNPTLKITGSVTVDWGDGTVDTSLSHTYASDGEYIIKISGSFTFSTNYSTYLLGSNDLNKALQRIYLDNITNIGNYAFQYCYSLENVNIPNSITSIGNYIFQNCYSLKNINIPNNITTIGSNVFFVCSSLKSISIPSGVTSIGNSAFSSCYSLKDVSIPNSVISIGASAFNSCYSFKSISIPNGITSLGNSVFNMCYSIRSISIPNNIISIGSGVFSTCYTLTNYFILCDQVPTLDGTGAFSSINVSCIMWVNDEIFKELQTATNWSTYASYMKRLSDCPQHLLDENGIEL